MRVAVVGAGVAGISASHALRGAGCEVELFERAPEARSTGYQLNLYANGLYALEKLGLLEPLRVSGRGGAIRAAPILDGPSGRLVRTMRTVWDPEGEYAGVSLFRGHLHEVLLGALRGPQPRYGMALRCFHEDPSSGRVRVEFEDGSSDEFDLLVGADGVDSQVRARLFPAHPGVVIRLCSVLFAFHIGSDAGAEVEELFAEQVDRGEFPQFIAPGAAAILSHGGGGDFAAVIAVPDPAEARGVETPEDARALARRQIREMRDPRVHYAVEAGYWEEGNPLVWQIGDVDPLTDVARGAVALCGDAAHPMMPVVAQGANQSFEDAWRLACHLEDAREPSDIRAALESYSHERAPHVARAQREGRRRILPVRFPRLARRPLAHRLYRGLLAATPQRVFDRFDAHLLRYASADPECPIESP